MGEMERVLALETIKKVGKDVVLYGWVQSKRDFGKLIFLDIRDRSGIVQVVAKESAKDLRHEYVVKISGTVKKRSKNTVNPDLVTGTVEIEAKKIEVLSEAEEPPIPVVEKGEAETSLDKRLDWRWIDLRKPENALIFKVWTAMEEAFREYWIRNNYIEIHSPKLMGAPSEGSAELFEVEYFEGKAYLAQSPQFYKQMAMASGFERVFEVGPVFRANPSFTSRHDTEFTGYDIEISFIESHQSVIAEGQEMISYALAEVKKRFGEEIKRFYGRELIVPSVPFPQVTMGEAKKILVKRGVKSERVGDLSPEEERELSKHIKDKEGHEFVFVTDYPVDVRPFYHMRYSNKPNLTKSFDLLWNGLEIITGAQREHRYDVLVSQAKEKGLKLETIQFYLDFFRYGCPPHGGFGLGPSRMLMKIFDVSNVREVTYIYRGPNRLTP